jgi:hypothetical protein
VATTSITDKDLGLKRILKQFKLLDKQTISTGYFRDAPNYPLDENFEDNYPVAHVAFIQEYGDASQKIPQRNFMSFTFGMKKDEWLRKYNDYLDEWFSGKWDVKTHLEFIGSQMASDMKKSIMSWAVPANRPFTVQKKGFNDPLIETGTMLHATAYKVRRTRVRT